MIISHKYKFIFIAIPKSASQYIRKIIRPHLGSKDQEICMLFDNIQSKQYPNLKGVGHKSARRIKKEVGEKIWNSYFKFAFIRDPYERIISIFSFKRKKQITILKEKNKDNTIKEIYNQNPFTKTYYHGKIQSFFKKTQSHWIFDDNNNLMIDFIGSMNNLHNDLKFIFKKVGLPEYIEKPSINKSIQIDNYYKYYNNTLISLIHNDFSIDIKNFKEYNFLSNTSKDFIKNNKITIFQKKSSIDYNNERTLTNDNIISLKNEIIHIKNKLKYIKTYNKVKHPLYNIKNQINIIDKNSHSNSINQTIQPISMYNNITNLIYNYLNNYIKDFTILSLKYIELKNNEIHSKFYNSNHYFNMYHYTIIIPLNNIIIKEDEKRYLLNPGNIFYINSKNKISFEYCVNTQIMLLELLHYQLLN